jgi:hypothetical protein
MPDRYDACVVSDLNHAVVNNTCVTLPFVPSTNDILDCADYTFSHDNGLMSFSDTVQNMNVFRRLVGVVGSVFNAESGGGALGAQVDLIRRSTGDIVASAIPDEDGYYTVDYKHTGKAALYSVKLAGHSVRQDITLKANSGVVVDFLVSIDGTAVASSEAGYGGGMVTTRGDGYGSEPAGDADIVASPLRGTRQLLTETSGAPQEAAVEPVPAMAPQLTGIHVYSPQAEDVESTVTQDSRTSDLAEATAGPEEADDPEADPEAPAVDEADDPVKASFAAEETDLEIGAERNTLLGAVSIRDLSGVRAGQILASEVSYNVSYRNGDDSWTSIDALCVSEPETLSFESSADSAPVATLGFACKLAQPVPESAQVRLETTMAIDGDDASLRFTVTTTP